MRHQNTGGGAPVPRFPLIDDGLDRRRLTYDYLAALVHSATRQGWSKGSDDAVTS